jgi:hypothetical protein
MCRMQSLCLDTSSNSRLPADNTHKSSLKSVFGHLCPPSAVSLSRFLHVTKFITATLTRLILTTQPN